MKVGIIFEGFFEDCEIHKVFDVSNKDKLTKCYKYIFKNFIEDDLDTDLNNAKYEYERTKEKCEYCNDTNKIQKVYANETIEIECDKCGERNYADHYEDEFNELEEYYKKAKKGDVETIKKLMKIYDDKIYFVIETVSVLK